MKETIVCGVIGLFAVVAQTSAQPPQYSLQFLGEGIKIEGMNASGVITGWSITGPTQSFVAGPDHPWELLPLPDGYISAMSEDINDAGVVVGTVYAAGHQQAAAWIPDGDGGWTIELLGALPGHDDSSANAINNRGDIVGISYNPGAAGGPTVWFNPPSPPHPPGIMNLSELGAPTNPQDVNDNGLVVGFVYTMIDLDTLESMPIPPDTLAGTAVMAVNNNDDLVGYAVTFQNTRFAVRHTEQLGWEQLGGSGGGSAPISAWDINDDGVTVGDMIGPAVHFDEFGTLSLASQLAPDQGNWSFCNCYGEAINNAGQIAAIAEDLDTFDVGVVLLTPIVPPNPADLDGDGIVGINDFLIVLGNWGPCPGPCPPACLGDADGDCEVGILDFLMVLGNWS